LLAGGFEDINLEDGGAEAKLQEQQARKQRLQAQRDLLLKQK
jgi:hypothetical protein